MFQRGEKSLHEQGARHIGAQAQAPTRKNQSDNQDPINHSHNHERKEVLDLVTDASITVESENFVASSQLHPILKPTETLNHQP